MMMRRTQTIVGLILGLTLICAVAGCQSRGETGRGNSAEAKILHVATAGDDELGDGSEDAPYATITGAISSTIGPGSEIIVHEGIYDPVEIGPDASGSADAPNLIRAAEGEAVVIAADRGSLQSGEGGMKEQAVIHLTDVSNVTLRGFEVEGGTCGILYESTPRQGTTALENVSIDTCRVHDVVGAHGIAVYARNDLAPVRNLSVSGCEVYDCLCGDSESLVLNGNIDGFTVNGNVIHDNNNIGIDLIGFEGTARHEQNGGFDNLYSVDFVRNGTCHDNVVYNISTRGNPAYREAGEYNLCAAGMYVDGGQDIEIYNNFVFNCDIGLEVATEHSPDDNELFKVRGVRVHDNVVAGCRGWCGLCFGGHDKDLGFTEDCEFSNNTFVDNGTQVGVQRSRNNSLHDNLFVGEDCLAIEFNGACEEGDMVNDLGPNTWCIGQGNLEDYMEAGDCDIVVMMPNGALEKQTVLHDRARVLDGFRSLVEGVGSAFVPDDEPVELVHDLRASE